MGLSIKNATAERLIRELADERGLGVTQAVTLAVSNELSRGRSASADDDWAKRWDDIHEIQKRVQVLPIFDNRTDDEILGYGEDGLAH